jgi:protein tyrosine/serine phosphatase
VEREIDLEGCANFRDVGGYPADGGSVRWRRLFRSDALHELTPADASRLGEIGLTTVIDLRSEFERGHDGDGPHPLKALGVRFVHAPLITELTGEIMSDTSLTLAQRYARILERGGPALAQTVTAIAESGGAAVFHCAAGKDRTGMVSAVVLGVLGVPDADVVADYALTGRNLAAIDARIRRHPAYETTYAYVPKDVMGADAETMTGLIEALRERHGGMRELLESVGVTGETLARLRTSLVV